MASQDFKGDHLPAGIEFDRPSSARIYDYLLGGFHNFEIDRQMAERFVTVYPDLALTALVNRAYLRRAAEFMVSQGIDQILDLGSGIPTVGNVHEVVRRRNPAARVVYVDIDPVAIAHAEAILSDQMGVIAIQGDIRRPETILEDDRVRELIDFSRPLGLFAVAVLHFIPDEAEAQAVITAFKRALAPGSYLALGVWTYDGAPRDAMATYEQLTKSINTPGRPRTRQTILGYLAGLELVEPGLVHSPQWRPDSTDSLLLDDPARCLTWVGVARKP